MPFNSETHWSTHFENLDAMSADDEWAASILEYLRKLRTQGLLVISSMDAFRSVNTACGRPAADAHLKDVWNRLSTTPRVLFGARWSGDSFIFLVDANRENTQEFVAEYLAPHKLSETITAYKSLGCALIPEPNKWIGDGAEWSMLREAADMAHVHAKKRGGNMAVLCTKPLGITSTGVNDFYHNLQNFEVLYCGEPSRLVHEARA